VPLARARAGLVLAGLALAAPLRAGDDSIGPVLSYRQPAARWVEALPVGNGRLGGMVFGGVPEERIQLNEGTFWSGGPYDPVDESAGRHLAQVRKLIDEGRYREAQDLADQKMMGRPRHLQAYQPLGDLRIAFEGHERPTAYERELDLDRAVVRVRYRVGTATVTREVFSSAPDRAIVVRIAADGPARLRLRAALDSRHPYALSPLGPRGLLMTGRWRGDLERADEHLKLSHGLQARWFGEGLAFAVRVEADAEGGRVEADASGLRVVDARAVTLRLAAATSFRGGDPAADVAGALKGRRPYAALLARPWPTTARSSAASASGWAPRTRPRRPRTSGWSASARALRIRGSPRRTSSTGATCSSPARARAASPRTCRASGTTSRARRGAASTRSTSTPR
jgi:alpha-L-fucosidase 2